MIKEITFTETYQLRHQVMNPKRTSNDMHRPGDECGRHFGYSRGSDLVGVISFYPETETEAGEFSQTTWRIRGMAVNKDFQGMEIGKQLFDFGVMRIQPNEIWLNSRTNAVGFYSKLGFKTIEKTTISDPQPEVRYRTVKRLTYSEKEKLS